MTEKVLSVITITYNNFGQLCSTLDSISGREYIESIVINGGTCEKTKAYLKNYNGISVSEPDGGIADAFNKGIKLATTGLIMILNSGDTLCKTDYLSAASSFLLHSNDISFTYSNLLFHDSIGGKIILRSTNCNLGRGMPYLHPTMIVKKEVFQKTGYFNIQKQVGMDFDWVVRLQKSGFKGKYFNGEPVVVMDGTGTSIIDESIGIQECYHSLKEHQYITIPIAAGLIVRVILFLLRKLLIVTGAGRLLGALKRMKYKTA